VFDVGSIWIIRTWEGSEDGGMTTDHRNWEVLEYTGTLLRVSQAGREWVINTASPAFAGAEPQPPVPDKITFNIGRTLPGQTK
jgi:hypothetical protein